MEIAKHISALLYRYQCVIVPGFGAFLTEIRSARFDEDSQSFFPPQKAVSFNSQLKNNDGLLANHISQEETIAYDTAVHRIEEQVAHWIHQIQTEGVIQLQNLGRFVLNEESKIEFSPIYKLNYLTSSFGLAPLNATPILRNANKETPVIPLPQRKSTKYRFLRYASVFVLLAGIGGIITQSEYQNYISNETTVVEKEVQHRVQEEIQQATFVIDSSIKPITLTVKKPKTSVHPYHIVASAFRSEENAKKATATLKSKGFENALYLPKNKYGLYPVLYGSYPKIEDAQNILKTIHKTENQDAWILIQ